MIQAKENPHYLNLSNWVVAALGMTFVMLVLGGLTRLTKSGLSITEWQPVTGILPPLTEAEWCKMFALYQNTPEYHFINHGMSLQEFKGIFWLEYIHRLWGRLLGIVILIPGLWLVRYPQRYPKAWLRWIMLVLLVGAQGAMGWYMVKSGLEHHPWVSPYRLTAHLLLCLLIFYNLIRLLASLEPKWLNWLPTIPPALRSHGKVLLGLVIINIGWGGLVAGMGAGLVYNDFPWMNGALLPEDMWRLQPWYMNLIANEGTVQLIHRMIGIGIGVYVVVLWYRFPQAMRWLGGVVMLQVVLGILTLWYQVPIILAALHQLNAFILFGVLVAQRSKGTFLE